MIKLKNKKGKQMDLTLTTAQIEKIKSSPKQHIGDFIFTIPTILAALGAVGSLAEGAAAKELTLQHFRGVFMSEELQKKKKTKVKECGVVNVDKSENIGRHSICYRKDKDVQYVFDSYGDVPTKPLIQYLVIENLIYNDNCIQDFNSVICGHLCVKVLKLLNEGYSFSDVVNRLKNVKKT